MPPELLQGLFKIQRNFEVCTYKIIVLCTFIGTKQAVFYPIEQP
jgi:hypothetical protein